MDLAANAPVVSDAGLVDTDDRSDDAPPLLSALPAFPAGDPGVQIDLELDELNKLEEDWDGAGSLAPKAEAIECARAVIVPALRPSFGTPSAITSAPNGDVILEWHRGGVFDQVRISGKDEAVFSRVEKGKLATHRRIVGPR
jgi:hypothetical protein